MLLFFVALSTSSLWAQKTIKGVVTSATDGEPLVGVSVQVAGTATGGITNIDGEFSVQASQGQTLVFSYIGFLSQEVKVGASTIVNVVLREDHETLSEVVVVGYGQMRRSDLTGAVTSVNDEAIKKSVPTSIDQVLQGRAAGVQITTNSGTPGGSTSIRIRGTNSLNATNQPIFVIDGVVVDSSIDDETNNPLASINPADVVSMDILKDASACAIYGARASNGVIMITTKRGKSGEATITYDGYIGWQSMPKYLAMQNLQEYAVRSNARADANIISASDYYTNTDVLGEGTDWQRELFRNAMQTNHSLSITGGSESATYAISGGYLNQDGIARGSSFERLTFRGNIDANMKKWLKGGLNFSMSDSKQNVGTDNSIIMYALQSQPATAVTTSTGSYDGPDDQWMPDNQVALAEMRTNYNKKENFRLNGYLEATLYKGLTLKTELSQDYNLNRYYYYEPDYTFGVKTNETRTGTWTKTNTKYWSWRNILSYNNTFAQVHAVNAMLGQEMSANHWETQVSNATGYLSNSATDPSAGDASDSSGTGYQNNSSIASFFGRAFYSYDDRYLITATLRRDGSSRFAAGNRWGWFPSAALAWKVSNEAFMKNVEQVDNLKLRLGWGATGNQNVGDWAYMALLSTKTTPWGNGVLNANSANPNLKWETTYSYNVGFDLNMFNSRIEFVADFYYKKTKDLLLQVSLPAFLGTEGYGAASEPWTNIGSVRNMGMELTLNTVNIDRKGFQWTSNFVFSMNRNKVLSLDTDTGSLPYDLQVGSDTSTVTYSMPGYAIGQFWGYKVIGRFDEPTDFYYTDEDGNLKEVAITSGSTISESGTWLGDFIFEDVNGDGVIDTDDEQIIGNPEPKFTFGIGNTFSWKGFDLTIFLSGSYGNDILNYNKRWLDISGSNSNVLASCSYAIVEKIDENGPDNYRNYHVTGVVGPNALAARMYTSSGTNMNWRVSDYYIEDGSYLRIKNVSLAYNFPRKWLRSTPLTACKLYVNIQNLYTWTNYSGYDPEVGALYGNALYTGIDYGRYPSPKTYTFGATVSF